MSAPEFYPFQRAGAKYLSSRKRAALFWGMGCGKTITAIGAIDLIRPKRVLIVLPASLRFNWQKEIRKWSGLTSVRYKIVSYNFLQKEDQAKELAKLGFDLCICDEAHALKSWQAKQTRNFVAHVFRKCKRLWFLTGTPSTRSAEDYHSLFSMLEPGVHGKFKSWCERYCYKRQIGFGRYRRTFWTGYRRPEELREIARRVGSIVKLKDVVKELPDIRFSTFHVSVKSSREVDSAKIKERPPEELLPALQELGRAKAKQSIEWLLEFNEPVVVFAYFRSTIAFLEEALEDRVVGKLTGADSPEAKRASIERFNKSKKGFLLANLLAGGTGHNLQHASVCVFIELPWSPAIFSQAYHRVYRIGQKEKVNVYSVLSRGTYDDRLLNILKEKSIGQNKVLAR